MSFADQPVHGTGRAAGRARPASGSASVGGRASVPSASGTASVGRASAPVSGSASVPGSASGSASVPGVATPPSAPPRGIPHSRRGRSDSASTGPSGRRPPGSDRGPDGRPLSPDVLKKLKKKKRRRKIALISLVLVLLLIVGAMGAGYAAVQVPLPSISALQQTSYVYYSDGSSQLARLVDEENREYVKIKDIPKRVQHAVAAAEDRSFWKNDGISFKGMMRAVWANVTGSELQGASTITQQYVKNAFLSQERTFSRKMKEIVLSVKMDEEYSKDEIMEFYLNTIYLGRRAYGIEAASKAYFGVGVKQLTTEQAAFIAGIIQAPSNYDPEDNKEGAERRFKYVLGAMSAEGWYKKNVSDATFPETIPSKDTASTSGLGGVSGTIMTSVQKELLDQGFSEQQIFAGGLRVTTTIDPKMQEALNAAVAEKMKGQKEGLGAAVVAVEPGTGEVKAYYGGEGGFGKFDYAGAKAPHPAGSSFKPYVLATGLEEGISINSRWDGSSPKSFPDRPNRPVRNSEGNARCSPCTMVESTVQSLNTPYYALAVEVGAERVVELAERAGITALDFTPTDEFKSEVTNNISVGQYAISVLDQAAGFATFAAQGKYVKPHFVKKVVQEGQTLYEANPTSSRAFDQDVAADATYVMEKVVAAGKNKLAGGRKSAGKTGTHQYHDTGHNAHAWMCGYTPQLAAAVWVGQTGDDGPIYESNGKNMYGSGLPGKIWKAFMDKALEGKPKEKLPAPKHIGETDRGNAAEAPAPSPAPDPNPSPAPDLGIQPMPGTGHNGQPGGPESGYPGGGRPRPGEENQPLL